MDEAPNDARAKGILADPIHSQRLMLRRWVESDAEALSAAIAVSLDHLRPWMPWAAFEPMSPEDRSDLIRQWQTEWEQGGDVVVGVLLGSTVVGGAGLHRWIGFDGLEIGYWTHAGHTRQGYATEAAAALTTAALALPAIERVEIQHDKANLASGGVPRRLGFEFAGEAPREVVAPGEIGIGCRWRMTEQRWAQRSGSSRFER